MKQKRKSDVAVLLDYAGSHKRLTPWQMDYLCRCRRFLYSRLFYYLKRIHGQPP